MRLSVLRSSFVRAAVLLAALGIPAVRATAQAGGQMREYESYSSVGSYNDGSSTYGCQVSWEAGPFSRTCAVGNFTGQTSGWVSDAGELHAGARLETYFDWAEGSATALVRYHDQLRVVEAPAELSVLRFNLFLHGRFAGDRSSAELFLSGSVHAGEEWEGSAARLRMRAGEYASYEYGVKRLSVDVPVVGGLAEFGLSLRADAVFGTGDTCPAVDGQCYGFPLPNPIIVFADFANTAGMESIEALDADGNAVSGYTLRSAQGNRYALAGGTMDAAPVVTTTPEPASLALVGTGALGLLGIAARRRRAR